MSAQLSFTVNFGRDSTGSTGWDNLYYFLITLDETNVSPGSNKSDLYISSAVMQGGGPRAVAGTQVSFSWSLNWGNGTTTSGSQTFGGGTSIQNISDLIGKTVSYTHEEDGSKSVNLSISVSGNLWDVWMKTAYGNASVTATLTDFNVSNTVSATDANIGSASTIVVSKYTPSLVYSLQYEMLAGNGGTQKTGYIDASGNSSSTEVRFNKDTSSSTDILSFVLPDTFYYAIPNNKTGTCKIYVRTYLHPDDETPLDYDPSICSYAFIATAAESICRPIVSGSISDINPTTIALTGGGDRIVKYFSTARVSIHAKPHGGNVDDQTGIYGTSIVSKRINTTTISPTTVQYDIPQCESALFNLEATDSRGYVNAPYPVPAVLIDYIKLTNNATVSRYIATENDLTINFSGNYFTRYDSEAMEYVGGSFGETDNTLEVKYRYKIAGGTYPESYTVITPTIRNGRYSYSQTLHNMSYTNQYVFELVVTDKLMSMTVEASVTRGIPVFDWGANDFNINGDFSVTADDPDSGNITADGDISTKNDLYVSNQIYYGKTEQGVDIPIEDTYPTLLPNPNALSLNILGTQLTYDGSQAVSKTIAMPGVFIDELARPRYGNNSRQGPFDVTYDASKNYKSFAIAYFGWASNDNVPSTTFINNGTAGTIICYYSSGVGRTYNAVNNGTLSFGHGILNGGTNDSGCLICAVYGIRIGY